MFFWVRQLSVCVLSSAMAFASFTPLAHAASIYVTCDDQGNLKGAKTNGGSFNYSAKKDDIQLLRDSVQETCHATTECLADLKQLRSNIANNAEVLEHLTLNLFKTAKKSNRRDELLSSLHRMQGALGACEQVRKKSVDFFSKNHIEITYPYQGPNKAKAGTHYDRARIERAVRLALLNGVDPNLALGILLTENAPIDSKQSEEYSRNYGLLPINALPAYDYLGCIAPKSKPGRYRYASSAEASAFAKASQSRLELESEQREQGDKISAALLKLDPGKGSNRGSWAKLYLEKCKHPILTLHMKACFGLKKYLSFNSRIEQENGALRKIASTFEGGDPVKSELVARELSCGAECGGFLIPQKEVPTFEVRTDNGPVSEYKVCTSDRTIKFNSYPTLELGQGKAKGLGCCTTVHASEKSDKESVEEDTKSALALKFMNERIHSRKDPKLGVAHVIQTYNGLGKLGVTEKVKNNCLSGLNMAETPVYGAKVADLMANSVMNNPEIQGIIRRAAAEFNTPVRSLFCEKLGEGSHSIPSDMFYNEQRRWLLEREPSRKAACAPFFK
jgi:hypothetical protein